MHTSENKHSGNDQVCDAAEEHEDNVGDESPARQDDLKNCVDSWALPLDFYCKNRKEENLDSCSSGVPATNQLINVCMYIYIYIYI
jgi:hypothetical protein